MMYWPSMVGAGTSALHIWSGRMSRAEKTPPMCRKKAANTSRNNTPVISPRPIAVSKSASRGREVPGGTMPKARTSIV